MRGAPRAARARRARLAAAIGWLRRRPTLAAALVYALLSLLMFTPAFVPGRTLSPSDYLWTAAPWEPSRPDAVPLLGSNREQLDAVTLFQPFLEYTRAALPDIPLWNPHIMGGRPFLGNAESAVFSPFSLPAYVLPFLDSLAVMAVLKLFVAALGAYLLGRVLGMRFGGALLTGLVFGFSLWSVTWVPWTTMSVWAFLPWLCLLSELCVRHPGPLPFAGLAAVVGLQFVGGHPSSSFQVVVAVALFWALRVLLVRPFRARAVGLRLLTLGGAIAAGTLLAALVLIPFVELLAHSIDPEIRSAYKSHEPGRYLLGLFLHDWWGRGSRVTLEFASGLEEHAYYVAALPLMLAGAALVLRRRRERVVVAAVGAGALAVAVGIPPLFDLVAALPGFSESRNGRLAVITVLCVAVLAGWGLDDLSRGRAPAGRRRLAVWASSGLAVLPLLIVVAGGRIHLHALGSALRVAWGFATPTKELASQKGGGIDGLVHLASLLEWLVLAVASLALLALRARGRLGVKGFVALAIALTAADLFKAGMGYNPAITKAQAEQPATGAIRFLRAQRPERFAGLRPVAPVSPAVPLPPDVAMRYGLYDARGYDLPMEKRYTELWRSVITPLRPCNYAFCPQAAATNPGALKALGLLGVRYLLQGPRDPPLHGRFRLAYAGADARVYRNPIALPRAFLVDRQVVARSAAAARQTVTSPAFAPRLAAVTERRLPGLAVGGSGAAQAASRARVTSYRREQVIVRTDAVRPALLVLTDSWFPGWQARVDGRPAPVHRVDYLIRGVLVPRGSHRVELRYEPASWRVGWVVSVLAFAGILATALLAWRRPSRRTRAVHRGTGSTMFGG
jgi:hypothetical protein